MIEPLHPPLDGPEIISEVVAAAPLDGRGAAPGGGQEGHFGPISTAERRGQLPVETVAVSGSAQSLGARMRVRARLGDASAVLATTYRSSAVALATLILICAATPALYARSLQLAVPPSLDQDPAVRRLITDLSNKGFDVRRKHVPGTLADLLEATRRGEAALAILPIEAFSDPTAKKQSNLAAMLSLPFQFATTDELLAVQDGSFGPAVLNDISDKDLRALSLLTKGMSQLAANRLVKSSVDLAGLRVASLGKETDILLKRLSGVPVWTSNPVVDFSNTNIDAFEWMPATAAALIPPVKGVVNLHPEFRPIVSVLVANANFWEAITEAERLDIGAVAKVAEQSSRELALRIAAAQKQAEVTKKIEYIRIGEAGFSRLHDDWKDAFLSLGGDPSVVPIQFKLFEEARAEAKNRAQKKTERPIVPDPGTSFAQAPTSFPLTLFVTNRKDEINTDSRRRFGRLLLAPDPFTCGVAGSSRAVSIFTTPAFTPLSFPKGFAACSELISEVLKRRPANGNSVLVYFHGFYNTFEVSVNHGLELGTALQFPGIILVWAWPSDGTGYGYAADGETAQLSEEAVNRFLSNLIASQRETNFYLVAHSMGARILLSLMDRLAQDRRSQRVQSVVFAAGDLNQDFFYQQFSRIVGAQGSLGHPTLTNYASLNDWAINRSAWAHIALRMGSGGDRNIFARPGVPVQSLESSALAGEFFFNHNYTLDPRAIADLRGVLQGLSPSQRNRPSKFRPMAPGTTPSAVEYWYFP